VKCNLKKDYRYNHSFDCIRGHEWFDSDTGNLLFVDPVPQPDDKYYKTIFGPYYSNPTCAIFCACNHCLNLALRRHTGAREPLIPGADESLRANQRAFLQSDEVKGLINQMRTLYTPYFEEYTGSFTEAELRHGEPHPKRLARIHAWLDMLNSGLCYQELWLLKHYLNYKIKMEIARQKKLPRAVIDFRVPASLQGAFVTNVYKIAQSSEPLLFNNGCAQFVKSPTPDSLRHAFLHLLNPPGDFYFCYFSDDSCLAIRINGHIRQFNLDISGCDASHVHELFTSLMNTFPELAQVDIAKLILQSMLPIKLMDQFDETRKRYVLLKPKGARLFSGSTLTTSINNFASILICLAVTQQACSSPDDVVAAARRAGYIVTLSECHIPEDLQFLKNSPCFDNGYLHPTLNCGVFIRMSGCCHRDLPGSGPIIERAKIFQALLLNGAYPRLDTPLLNSMRANFPMPTKPVAKQFKTLVDAEFSYKSVNFERYNLTTNSFLKRYNLAADEVCEVEEFFKTTVGTVTYFRGLTKILMKDYDIEDPGY
jgi:hypothetical protein